MDFPLLSEELEFLRIFWAINHIFQKESKQLNSLQKIASSQRLALQMLARFPGITAKQLANLLYVHPSTLTTIISKLEKKKLIYSFKDPKDARRSLLSLSVEGRKFEKTIEDRIRISLKNFLKKQDSKSLAKTKKILLDFLSCAEEAIKRSKSNS